MCRCSWPLMPGVCSKFSNGSYFCFRLNSQVVANSNQLKLGLRVSFLCSALSLFCVSLFFSLSGVFLSCPALLAALLAPQFLE